MLIQNIEELNLIVAEINKLSEQLEDAYKRLQTIDLKINPDFLQDLKKLSTSH